MEKDASPEVKPTHVIRLLIDASNSLTYESFTAKTDIASVLDFVSSSLKQPLLKDTQFECRGCRRRMSVRCPPIPVDCCSKKSCDLEVFSKRRGSSVDLAVMTVHEPPDTRFAATLDEKKERVDLMRYISEVANLPVSKLRCHLIEGVAIVGTDGFKRYYNNTTDGALNFAGETNRYENLKQQKSLLPLTNGYYIKKTMEVRYNRSRRNAVTFDYNEQSTLYVTIMIDSLCYEMDRNGKIAFIKNPEDAFLDMKYVMMIHGFWKQLMKYSILKVYNGHDLGNPFFVDIDEGCVVTDKRISKHLVNMDVMTGEGGHIWIFLDRNSRIQVDSSGVMSLERFVREGTELRHDEKGDLDIITENMAGIRWIQL